MRKVAAAAAILAALSCAACAPGLIYTNITEPLVVNMQNTPSATGTGYSETKHIELPASAIRISAEWDSRAIGDAARQAGLKTVHFADLQTVSVLGGVWMQQRIHVWGE
jgi:hypothetical protein